MATGSRLSILGLLLLVGCSSGPVVLSPDGDYFEGLDPAVVEEIVENPAAIDMYWLEGKEYEAAARGTVIRYCYCRELLRVYEEWLTTGILPEFNWAYVGVDPNNAPSGTDSEGSPLVSEWSYTLEVLDSGDIELLRSNLLVNPNGYCGDSVPAKPGDINGPTIADVVKGMG